MILLQSSMYSIINQVLLLWLFHRNRTIIVLFDFIRTIIKIDYYNHIYFTVKLSNYYSFSYFTSTSTGILLSNKRFDTFQKESHVGHEIDVGMNKKIQHITELLNSIRFPANDVTVLKYGQKYIKYILQNDYFRKRFETLSTRSSIDYDSRNISQLRMGHIIDEHDARVYCGLPHPQTDHQIQQKMSAQEQQKKLQQEKKIYKEFNNKIFKDFKKPTHEPFN